MQGMPGWDIQSTYYGRPVADPCVKCLKTDGQTYLRTVRQTNGDSAYVYHCGYCATEYYSKYKHGSIPAQYEMVSESERILRELREKVKSFSLYQERKEDERNKKNKGTDRKASKRV